MPRRITQPPLAGVGDDGDGLALASGFALGALLSVPVGLVLAGGVMMLAVPCGPTRVAVVRGGLGVPAGDGGT